MNIKSSLKVLAQTFVAPQPSTEATIARTVNPTSFGIGSHPDVFDATPAHSNYFNGKFLSADSLSQEQQYQTSKARGFSVADVFDPMTRFNGVRLQQGRVILDSDYNEKEKKDDKD